MGKPTKNHLKDRAKHLRQILDKDKVQISHGRSLDITARFFGFKDWNTASAALEDGRRQSKNPKFHTVGDLREFLAKFDSSTELKVQNYDVIEADGYYGETTDVMRTNSHSLTFDPSIQEESTLTLELVWEGRGGSSGKVLERQDLAEEQERETLNRKLAAMPVQTPEEVFGSGPPVVPDWIQKELDSQSGIGTK